MFIPEVRLGYGPGLRGRSKYKDLANFFKYFYKVFILNLHCHPVTTVIKSKKCGYLVQIADLFLINN